MIDQPQDQKRKVVRTGVSPMNSRVKWAELECGHNVFLPRRPRIGTELVCAICSVRKGRESA